MMEDVEPLSRTADSEELRMELRKQEVHFRNPLSMLAKTLEICGFRGETVDVSFEALRQGREFGQALTLALTGGRPDRGMLELMSIGNAVMSKARCFAEYENLPLAIMAAAGQTAAGVAAASFRIGNRMPVRGRVPCTISERHAHALWLGENLLAHWIAGTMVEVPQDHPIDPDHELARMKSAIDEMLAR